MVEGQVDVDAADVRLFGLRQQQIGNPSADKDDLAAVLAEHVHDLDEYGAGGLDEFSGVVPSRVHQLGLITLSRRAWAASSPRPRTVARSRYACIGETTGTPSISIAP